MPCRASGSLDSRVPDLCSEKMFGKYLLLLRV